MIGLDTNVLIRYVVQDDPVQSAIATELIETRCTQQAPGFVCGIVLVEIVWVLERGYGYDKSVILAIVKQMLSTAELVIENADLVWTAVMDYESHGAGFADCLLGRLNQYHGCLKTYTFDSKAAKTPCFERLPITTA